MTRKLFLIICLCTTFLSLYCQEATLQIYPDLHFNSINSIDASDDGKNLLTSDRDGKIIYWDYEELKPLRLWNVRGRILDSKIILGDASAIALTINRSKVEIYFYDLFEGNQYGKLEVPSSSNLKAYSFGNQTIHKGSLYLLYEKELVAVNLYSKKITWRKEISGSPNKTDDIMLFRDPRDSSYVVVTKIDNRYSYYLANDGGSTPFALESINFKEKNIYAGYHIAPPKNPTEGNLELYHMLTGDKIFLKELTDFEPPHINKILHNKQFTYIHIKSEGIEEKVICYDKYGNKKWEQSLNTKDISLNKFNHLIYANPDREITILGGFNGSILNTIENNIRSSKALKISPDLQTIIYSDLGDTDMNIPEQSRQTASYYLNMSNGTHIYPLNIHKTNDVAFMETGYFLTVHDGPMMTQNGIRIPFDGLPYFREIDLKVTALQYDTISGNQLYVCQSNDKEKFTQLTFAHVTNPLTMNGTQAIAANINDHHIYGDITRIDDENSLINIPKNFIEITGNSIMGEPITLYNKGNVISGNFIPGGRYVQYSDNTPGVNQAFLYDTKTRTYINPYSEGNAKITKIVSDRKGERILMVYSDSTTIITSVPFKVEKQFKLNDIPTFITFQESKASIVYKAYQQSKLLKILNYETMETEIISNVPWPKYEDSSLDGRYIALSNNIAVGIIDLQNKKTIISAGNPFEQSITFVKFSDTQPIAVSANYNGRLKIWDLISGKLSATLVISENGKDFVIHEESGLFDATPGAMEDIYYVVRKEIVELSQLKDEFWEPDLLLMNLEGDLDNTPEDETKEFKSVSLYPDVTLVTDSTQEILKILLTQNKGGIGKVAFYINGVEIEEDINPDRETLIELNLSEYTNFLIEGRPNILGVKVSNADNTLISREKKIPVNYKKLLIASDDVNTQGKGGLDDLLKKAEALQLDTKKTRLIGLVIGTSNYEELPSKSIDLSYADSDALTVTNALKTIGKPLFEDESKIIIHTLTSDNPDITKTSSRSNILAEMEKIKAEVKVDDILFIFFSGHGVTHKDKYYYATKEANDNTINGKGAKIDTATISADEIKEFIRGTKSLRKVLILDACYSGAFNANVVAKSGESTQKKAMDKLKDKTGMYILSSSTGEQESFELKNLKQGLLTYSLMDGMSGKAANDNIIDVLRLISFVEGDVPRVAEINKVKQQPVFFTPEASSSFTLGVPDETLKPNGAQTIIGKSTAVDTNYTDMLELGQKFDKKIKSESFKEEATFRFSPELSVDFISLNSNYTILADGTISLKGAFRLHNTVLKKVNVKATSTEELIAKIFTLLEDTLKNMSIDHND